MNKKKPISLAVAAIVAAALIIFYFVLQEFFFPGYSPMVEQHAVQKLTLNILFVLSFVCCLASGLTALLPKPKGKLLRFLRYLPDILFSILALFQIYYVNRVSNAFLLGLPEMTAGGSHYLYIVYLVVMALALQGCFLLLKRAFRPAPPEVLPTAETSTIPAPAPESDAAYEDDDLTRGI